MKCCISYPEYVYYCYHCDVMYLLPGTHRMDTIQCYCVNVRDGGSCDYVCRIKLYPDEGSNTPAFLASRENLVDLES